MPWKENWYPTLFPIWHCHCWILKHFVGWFPIFSNHDKPTFFLTLVILHLASWWCFEFLLAYKGPNLFALANFFGYDIYHYGWSHNHGDSWTRVQKNSEGSSTPNITNCCVGCTNCNGWFLFRYHTFWSMIAVLRFIGLPFQTFNHGINRGCIPIRVIQGDVHLWMMSCCRLNRYYDAVLSSYTKAILVLAHAVKEWESSTSFSSITPW